MEDDSANVYTVIFNKVTNNYDYPLIGVVNQVEGNHKGIQIGMVNSNRGTFKGFQAGFINKVMNDLYGLQIGYVNSISGKVNGVESGFVNSVSDEVLGAQFGFVNSTNSLKGVQEGFVNRIGEDAIGMQNGFVNLVGRELKGLQVGFVNSAYSTLGVQHGFVNSSKKLVGAQLGFINIVDTLEAGVAAGFLSIVKHGGFHAIELSTNDNYLINLSFKIGSKGFYTFPVLSYNPHMSDRCAIGLGFGSNLQLVNGLSLNPELSSSFAITDNYREITTFNLSVCYSLNKHFDILAGPSSTWTRSITGTQINNDMSWMFIRNLSFTHDFALGVKCAVRYVF